MYFIQSSVSHFSDVMNSNILCVSFPIIQFKVILFPPYVCFAICLIILPLEHILVAAWSKVWVCVCSLAGIADSNPTEAWISVSCECCVLSRKGLCDGPILRPEEAYWVVCVIEIFSCNFNSLPVQWVDRRVRIREEERKRENKERNVCY
jgi:hypothetical protein